MTVRVEVELEEDGTLSITSSKDGEPMETDDILDCLDTACFALAGIGQKETLQ